MSAAPDIFLSSTAMIWRGRTAEVGPTTADRNVRLDCLESGGTTDIARGKSKPKEADVALA